MSKVSRDSLPTDSTLSDDEIARTDPDLCEHGWSRLYPQPCPECEDGKPKSVQVESDRSNTTEVVMLRFPREGYFTPIPARREWEKANGKRLQAINRYIDGNEVVIIYWVIP